MQPLTNQPLTLFLGGDVMTGRGIDQILPNPANPVLYEPVVRDAREYVQLAEAVSGPISRNVGFEYVWGDVLDELGHVKPDGRIVNLETSITSSENPWPKGINYRMSPENVGCLTAARIDCCCLANNHILDWGCEGLRDTIEVLDGAKIAHTGAGFDLQGATAPAVLDLDTKGRVLVFALGSPTSGIPLSWAAMDDRPGVNLVTDLSESSALRVADEVCAFKQFGDLLVVSIHWGENWGYEISANQINFAHRLIDAGVDLIHGHSSHHVKAIEVYRERLILYGCGDFLTDYEGIEGYEEFRGDLALIFLASFESLEHRLSELRIAPVHSQRFRLAYVPSGDAQWLSKLMSDICRPFATRVQLRDDKNLFLEWDHLS